MKSFDDQFDDSVRGAFDRYEEHVDPAALVRLRASLDATGMGTEAVSRETTVFVEKSSRRGVWQIAAGLLLAMGLLVLLGYFGSNRTVRVNEAGVATLQPMDPPPATFDAGSVVNGESVHPILMQIQSLVDSTRVSDQVTQASEQVALASEQVALASEQVTLAPELRGPFRAALTEQEPVNLPISGNELHNQTLTSLYAITPENRVSVIIGTNFTHTNQGLSDGIGLSLGSLRQWNLHPRVHLVTGGLLAWNQFSLVNSEMVEQVGRLTTTAGSVDTSIETETRYTTIALEIPLQGVVEVYRSAGRSFSVGAGLSSMVYLRETSVQQGVRYLREVRSAGNGEFVLLSSTQSFENRAEFAAFDRIDAARLLTLSVVYEIAGNRRPVMIELYTKQPLGALTSSEISYSMTGVTVRYSIW